MQDKTAEFVLGQVVLVSLDPRIGSKRSMDVGLSTKVLKNETKTNSVRPTETKITHRVHKYWTSESVEVFAIVYYQTLNCRTHSLGA